MVWHELAGNWFASRLWKLRNSKTFWFDIYSKANSRPGTANLFAPRVSVLAGMIMRHARIQIDQISHDHAASR